MMFIYAFVLFIVLTPGILFYFPKHKSKIVTNLFHALVFAIIWTFTHKFVYKSTRKMFEGLEDKRKHKKHKPKPTNKVNTTVSLNMTMHK